MNDDPEFFCFFFFFFSYFSLENEPEGVLYASICIKQTNKKLINNEKRKTGPALTVFHRTLNDKAFSISVLKMNCFCKKKFGKIEILIA